MRWRATVLWDDGVEVIEGEESDAMKLTNLSANFIAKYKPLGRGRFMDTWIDDMTKDELIAVIGYLCEEGDRDRAQARHDFNFAMDLARRFR
jgi:hypothetical protein